MIAPLMPTYARADLAFERGEGVWLTGTDGRRYLDFAGGVAVMSMAGWVSTTRRHIRRRNL